MIVVRDKRLFALLSIGLVLALSQSSSAQRRARVFQVSRAQLATLDEVQSDLSLTDEQKQRAEEINQKLSEDRRALFQGGGGDFDALREKIEKLTAAATAKLNGLLNDDQQSRITEIFVQANGPGAVSDAAVAEALELTEEQKTKLAAARAENRQAAFQAFRDFGNMSEDERREAMEKLGDEADKRILAVLNRDQREQLDHMQGDAIELDLSPLFRRRGG